MQFLSLHIFEETYPHAPSLRLNPLLTREALRRLAWAVFYQDTMADAGRHGVHLVTEAGFHIQLPCDEASFVRGLDIETAPLRRRDCVESPSFASAPSPISLEGPGHLGISAHLIAQPQCVGVFCISSHRYLTRQTPHKRCWRIWRISKRR